MEQIGPYRVVREVARGGQGAVYEGLGPDGARVAIKLLLAQRAESAKARRRFLIEVQALSRLRHPHVVPVLGVGEHQGSPWLALPFLDGESLEQRLRAGPLPVPLAIRVTQELAQALSYVHGCGVLHRDVKPANVLLHEGRAYLTDFGIARDVESSQSRITATGIMLGTPGYWAPELARGETALAGPRSDVYGLGGVFYACLTGQAPIEADSLAAYLASINFARVPSPRSVRPEVPDWLSDLCMHCLAVIPSQRPASADAVARELLIGPSEVAKRVPTWAWLAGAVVAAGALGAGLRLATSPTPAPVAPPAPPAAPLPPPEDPPPPEVDSTIELAKQAGRLLNQLRVAEALALYDEVLARDPNSPSGWSGRGSALGNLNRYPEALEALERAVALAPTHALSHHNLGRCLCELGRYDEALRAFDRADELRGPTYDTSFGRGYALRSQGRNAEAVWAFAAAYRLDPTRPSAPYYEALALLDLGHNPKALERVEVALKLRETASHHVAHGTALARLEKFDQAIEAFSHGLELEPQFPGARRDRGLAFHALRRVDEAFLDYEAALEFDPNDAIALGNIGAIRAIREDWDGAIRDFDRALELGLPPEVEGNVRNNRDLAIRLRAKAAR